MEWKKINFKIFEINPYIHFRVSYYMIEFNPIVRIIT